MYDIIVVGGGHAGCEAAHASAVMGQKTLLITSNIKNIADMPCNPSIGGTAKGIVVREIDALGGLMGKVADRTHFQIKMLNSKKGPAVRSLRAQADKKLYPKVMLEELRNTPNLTIKEGMVEDLIVENNTIKAVILDNKEEIPTKALILTTGTYLKSKILVGDQKTSSGPHGEKESKNLSDNLRKLGFEIQRLKTGTPPRIDKNTVDLKKLSEEYGDKEYIPGKSTISISLFFLYFPVFCSTVTPGQLPTCCFEPVISLNNVVLPQFGLPASAILILISSLL